MPESNGEKSSRRGLGHLLRNRPGWLNLCLLAIVIAHGASARKWHSLNPERGLEVKSAAGDASVLFLGAATVAAMVAGFAGVIVIFGLSTDAERFRYLRQVGGERLQATWTSVVSTSFGAAGLSLAASYLRLTDTYGWMWSFEAALVLLAHAALRLLWLLWHFAAIIRQQDKDQAEKQATVAASSVVLPHRKK